MSRTEPLFAIVACVLFGPATSADYAGAQSRDAYVVASRMPNSSSSQGLIAIDTAARSGKHLFIFFWQADDEQSRSMYGVFQAAMSKWQESADSLGIQVADPNEKPIVDKFGLSRAPMPIVLALAPNGAVTKAFPVRFDENQLRQGFVSPCTAQCLKCLQEQRLAILCVRNEKTQSSQAAWQGVQAFKADPRFSKATEIVTLDPDDPAEVSLLGELNIDRRTPQAVTVVLAPPGQPVATFVGAVTKEQIVAKIQAGPCAGGQCGPGGCCPAK